MKKNTTNESKNKKNYILELATTKEEEIANFVSHVVGAGLGIIGLFILVIKASWHQNVLALISYFIFSLGIIILYTMSSIYHILPMGRAKRVFEILDHSAIYILIASSYTPYLALVITGTTSIVILLIQWVVCILGIIFKAFYTGKFRGISTLIYLFMGWMVVFTWSNLIQNISIVSLIWLVIGGLFYSIGTIFYMWRLFKYHHMVWHLFVLLGSLSHFFSVLFIKL